MSEFRVPKRILVVEDNVIVALMVADELEEAGYTVMGPASTARVALELHQEAPCECALIDIDLADGRTGTSLAATLNKRDAVRTIFMTGQRELAIAARAHGIGLLHKPVDPSALIATLRAMEDEDAGRDAAWPQDFERF